MATAKKETKVVADVEAKEVKDLGPTEETKSEATETVKAEEPKKKGFLKTVTDGIAAGANKVVSVAKKHPLATGIILGGAAALGGAAVYNKVKSKDSNDDTTEVEALGYDPEMEYLDELEAQELTADDDVVDELTVDEQ